MGNSSFSRNFHSYFTDLHLEAHFSMSFDDCLYLEGASIINPYSWRYCYSTYIRATSLKLKISCLSYHVVLYVVLPLSVLNFQSMQSVTTS